MSTRKTVSSSAQQNRQGDGSANDDASFHFLATSESSSGNSNAQLSAPSTGSAAAGRIHELSYPAGGAIHEISEAAQERAKLLQHRHKPDDHLARRRRIEAELEEEMRKRASKKGAVG